jgi:hypothetical protein
MTDISKYLFFIDTGGVWDRANRYIGQITEDGLFVPAPMPTVDEIRDELRQQMQDDPAREWPDGAEEFLKGKSNG